MLPGLLSVLESAFPHWFRSWFPILYIGIFGDASPKELTTGTTVYSESPHALFYVSVAAVQAT